MRTSEIIRLAEIHSTNGAVMQTSAQMRLAQAKAKVRLGIDAREDALYSLKYSVGVFHPDYQDAARKGF